MTTYKQTKLRELYINSNIFGGSPESRAEEFDTFNDDEIFGFEIMYYTLTLPTVKELRMSGHNVRVTHWRKVKGLGLKMNREFREKGIPGQDFCSKSGRTDVEIVKDGVTYQGTSVCSRNDNFVRRTGLAIAMAKALGKEVG